ncbi:MAG: hypothetical protein E7376_04210 [Clostridiales bacterium]|nr:hypothetical protein [Clostridiales bacterium]
MTFSLILLGVLLIFTLFGVGESLFKNIKINKRFLIIILLLSIALYFIPNVNIWGINVSLVAFILPLVFSIVVLVKVRNIKAYFKCFAASLIAFALNLVYNLINFEVYDVVILQPYLVLGLILGMVLPLLAVKPTRVYASTFLGLISSEIVFYYSRYSMYQEYNLSLGSEKVFAVLLVTFVTSLVVYYFIRKLKTLFIKHRLKKSERKNYAG